MDHMFESDGCAMPMWHWGARMPPEFAERLAQMDVVPLVLVAHWCMILPQIKHYWWVQGWVDRTMREIGEVLPQEYREWFDWPMGRIRLIRERELETARAVGEVEGQRDIRMDEVP